jgi:hypothetical protein
VRIYWRDKNETGSLGETRRKNYSGSTGETRRKSEDLLERQEE